MNIHDVPDFEYPDTCWLKAIFDRQESLRQKYDAIEKANGLMQTDKHPLNLHDRHCQARIKDFAWRFTEEIGESLECFMDDYALMTDDISGDWHRTDKVPHFREELMDALHFLTELTILVGMGPDDLFPPVASDKPYTRIQGVLLDGRDGQVDLNMIRVRRHIYPAAFEAIMHMGLTCNFLKNKPWKNTHQLTDEAAFCLSLKRVWHHFGKLLLYAGFDAPMIYDMYIRKNEVNKFRQRSHY